MRVIAFLGSPREGGNTEALLKAAIEGAGQEVRVFNLNRMDIRPCQNCGGCDETGVCIIEDGMGEIYPAIKGAERIILASPIFFQGLSAQAKAMIDRCQPFWCEKYLMKRPIEPGQHGRKGLLLLVGGQRREEGVKCSEATATAFFRSVSVPEHRALAYMGVDAKGAILRHPTALNEAREAGKQLVSSKQ